MQKFFWILFKFLTILFFSLSFFYFFETPFLIETAWAEETLSETTEKQSTNIGTTAEASATVKNSGEISNNLSETEKAKAVEPSLAKKIGYFVWDYKWYFLMTGVLILSSVVIYGILASPTPPEAVQVAPVDPIALLRDENLPNWKYFVEDSKIFSYSVEVTRTLPDHFMVQKAFFSDANNANLTGILIENPKGTTALPFRVYPVKPILYESSHNPVFDVLRSLKEQAMVPYDSAYAATIQVPEVKLAPNTPFLYSEDPSTSFWINQAKEAYPVLNELHPSLILQYQKVALVDPAQFTYAYCHQVSVVPTNIEALSTPYETNLQERLVRVYLFKDNEAGWSQ